MSSSLPSLLVAAPAIGGRHQLLLLLLSLLLLRW
jgi:hypothetical protein